MEPTSISYTSYSYDTPTIVTNSGLDFFAIFLAYIGIMMFVMITCYVVSSWLLSRIFKKAGIEEWKAWVPFYNNWIMLEMGDQKGWYLLLSLVPFVGPIIFMVFWIMALYEIGKKFSKDGIFVLWAVFLPVVWYAILAFDKSTWSKQGQPVTAVPTEPVEPETTDQPTQNT
jgi:hypothetical protein